MYVRGKFVFHCTSILRINLVALSFHTSITFNLGRWNLWTNITVLINYSFNPILYPNWNKISYAARKGIGNLLNFRRLIRVQVLPEGRLRRAKSIHIFLRSIEPVRGDKDICTQRTTSQISAPNVSLRNYSYLIGFSGQITRYFMFTNWLQVLNICLYEYRNLIWLIYFYYSDEIRSKTTNDAAYGYEYTFLRARISNSDEMGKNIG